MDLVIELHLLINLRKLVRIITLTGCALNPRVNQKDYRLVSFEYAEMSSRSRSLWQKLRTVINMHSTEICSGPKGIESQVSMFDLLV